MKIDSVQAERRQNASIVERKDVKTGKVEYDPGGGGGTTWASRANLSATYRNDLLPHHLKVAHDESLAAGSKPKVIEFLREHLDREIGNIVATTHSQEAIQAFLANPHQREDIVAYTLLREGGKVVAERFSGPDLEKMIDTTGYDIRRL